MQDGVRGHSPARRVSPALILLVLGLTTFFPTYTPAAPLDGAGRRTDSFDYR